MPSPRDATIYLLLAVLELLAGFALVLGSGLLGATSLHDGMFWILLLSGLIGMATALVASVAGLPSRWSRMVLLAVGVITSVLLALLVSTGPVAFLAVLILLGLAFWRGINVTAEPPWHAEVMRRFGYGFAVFFAGLILLIARGIIFQRPVWQLLVMLGFAYVVTAMVALGMARLEQMREPGATPAVALAIAAQLALLLLVGVAALQVFAWDITGLIGHALLAVMTVLGQALVTAISPLVSVAVWLVELLRPHGQAVHHASVPPPTRSSFGNGKRLHAPKPSTPLFVVVGGVMFAALLLVGIAGLIWKALPSLPQPRRTSGYREERRWLLAPDALWHALLAWLRSLLHRSAEAAAGAAQTTRRQLLGPEYPSDPVRRLYAQVLQRAAAAGLPRSPITTPTEFGMVLAARWPEGAGDFATLTEAYALRRYGEVALAPQEIAALQERWQHLRRVMRRPPAPVQPTPEIQAEGAQEPASGPAAPSGPRWMRWRHALPASFHREPTAYLQLPGGISLRRLSGLAGRELIIWLIALVTPLLVIILVAALVWHL